MKSLELIFWDVIALILAVWTTLAVFITLMSFIVISSLFLVFFSPHLFVFDLGDNILDFIWIIVPILFSSITRILTFLGRADTDEPGLECPVSAWNLLEFWSFCSDLIRLKLVKFLFSFLLGEVLIEHEDHVFINALCNSSAHEAPWLRCEGYVFFLLGRIVESSRGLYCVTMWDGVKKDSPGSRPLEISYSKQAAIISEDLGLWGHDLGEYSSLVVVIFPNFVLRSIKEDILFYRMPMEVEEKHQSRLEFCF